MRLLILGGTGQTGQPLIKQALDAQHHVTAVVRDPSKLEIQNDNLKVVTANIFDEGEMKGHLEGQDAVISCLGFPIEKPVTGFTRVTKLLTKLMKDSPLKRVILMHSWYTEKHTRDNAPGIFLRWFFLPYFLAPVLDDMRETEIYLEEHCASLDYTVVLPARLMNEPVTEKEFTVRDNVWSIPEAHAKINRPDVARYMLSILDDESSYRVVRCIATPEDEACL